MGVIDAINQLSGIFLFLERDCEQSVNKQVRIPSDRRSEMSVNGKVEAIMLICKRVFIVYSYILGLSQAS